MRLRSILPLAALLALAACDSKGPPKIGTAPAAPGQVASVAVPPEATTPLAAAPATSCPDSATIIAKACPPVKAAAPKAVRAPSKPIRVHHRPHPVKPVVRYVAAPREYAPVRHRDYARVEREVEVHEYAKVEAPRYVAPPPPVVQAPPPPPPRAQTRVEEEHVYETYRSYPPPPPQPRYYAPPPRPPVYVAPPPVVYAPPPPPPRYYAPPPRVYAPPPQVYYAPPPPPVYVAPPQPVYVQAPPRGPCCTYPAAGRDANGFLTWPGKR